EAIGNDLFHALGNICSKYQRFSHRAFKCSNLAFQHRYRHEMACAMPHMLMQDFKTAVQKNKKDRRIRCGAEAIPIALLQCGTGYHNPVARGCKTFSDFIEPGPAILVLQGDACRHLIDVRLWMKRVAFEKRKLQSICNLL